MDRGQFRGVLRGTADHINASLPSTDSAKAFLSGAPGSVGKIIGSTLLRSALIAPGLLLAGIEPKKAALGAVLGSIGITSFILVYISAKNEPMPPLLQMRGARRMPPRFPPRPRLRALPPRR